MLPNKARASSESEDEKFTSRRRRRLSIEQQQLSSALKQKRHPRLQTCRKSTRIDSCLRRGQTYERERGGLIP